MSRPRLGRQPSVTILLRVPGELADEIELACACAGETKSEVGRRLFASWLRQRRSIKRLKERTK